MIRPVHVHIIHVGSVTNKGTYAILKSEISEIKRVWINARITISTDDVAALRRLEPNLDTYSSLVDIPHEQADRSIGRARGRRSLMYRLVALLLVFLMPFQALFVILSAALLRIGFKKVYRSEILLQIQECDLVISTADENFKEGTTYLPASLHWIVIWWTMLFPRMIEVVITKRILGKTVIVFPNSLGPFRTWFGKLMARVIMANVDLIMLRDPQSAIFLDDLRTNVQRVNTTDIALIFETSRPTNGMTLPKPAAGVCPALYEMSFTQKEHDVYVQTQSRLLDYLAEEHGYDIVFLPHEISDANRDNDLRLSREITGRMKHSNKSRIIQTERLDEFKYYLGQLDLLISSRLHPAVLACADCIPTLMFAYDHKQSGLFATLGLSEYVISINNTDYEKCLTVLNRLLHETDVVRRHLQSTIPELRMDLRRKIAQALRTYVQRQETR